MICGMGIYYMRLFYDDDVIKVAIDQLDLCIPFTVTMPIAFIHFMFILQICFTTSNAFPVNWECTPSLILLILLGYASHRRASDQRAR